MPALEIKPVTLAEFQAMPKANHLTYELIDGLVLMAPSPSRSHQTIGGNLYFELRLKLQDTPCDVLYELDITAQNNSLRPDLMVFCDPKAELPEIVLEIISPSSRYRDLHYKVSAYERMGVKEYWIVDPKVQTITVHDYVHETAEVYLAGDTIRSACRPEIVVSVDAVFRQKLF